MIIIITMSGVLATILNHNMKYILSILAIISIGFFASCGGDAECCGECDGGDHGDSEGSIRVVRSETIYLVFDEFNKSLDFSRLFCVL